MDRELRKKLFKEFAGEDKSSALAPSTSEKELEEAKHIFERMLKEQKELKESLETSLGSFSKDI